ncbi:MAG: CDP-diacylglycerol--serine O-phosphatidyltransferase [Peptococcaceae bacterium]|nr:CDP-diacylglycerol--serine O-phosphatidyltransferase [Peptococcaceae bacterium]
MFGKTFDTRILPCIFTSANLFFGFLAIIFAMDHHLRSAAGMILLSVLMDSLDGKVARKLKASSDFGKELDSLSDVISFGLAPAVLIYVFVYQNHWPLWGALVSGLFTLCGALRLARFNILCSTDYFVGVPITFAGGFMALLLLFFDRIPWEVYPVAMSVLAVLMVSSLQVPKLGK